MNNRDGNPNSIQRKCLMRSEKLAREKGISGERRGDERCMLFRKTVGLEDAHVSSRRYTLKSHHFSPLSIPLNTWRRSNTTMTASMMVHSEPGLYGEDFEEGFAVSTLVHN